MSNTEGRNPPGNERPFIDQNELLVHGLYRERIVQEDNLINHRMMWMILSQAFLMALRAALAQKAFDGHPLIRWPMGSIAVVGGVFAFGSYMSIRAAQKEIDELRTKYLDMYQESDTPGNKIDPTRPVADKKLPGLTGSGTITSSAMPYPNACLGY